MSSLFHTEPHLIVAQESYLTGNLITVNIDPTRFLVSPSWKREHLAAAFVASREKWSVVLDPPTPALRSVLKAVETSDNREAFACNINAMLQHVGGVGVTSRKSGASARDRRRVIDLLLALWEYNAVAWPAGRNPFPRAQIYDDVILTPMGKTCVKSVIDTHRLHYTNHVLANVFALYCLKRNGLREIGDFTPETSMGMTDHFVAGSGVGISKTIVSMQVARYGVQRMRHNPEDLVPPAVKTKVYKSYDTAFTWVVQQDPGLESWRSLGAEWASELSLGKNVAISSLNDFFKHAIAKPNFPREPMIYLNRDKAIGAEAKWPTPSVSIGNKVSEFLDWVLDTRCSVEDADGVPVRLPGFRNPHSRRTHQSNAAETYREAMPTMFVRLALEILKEDDWAWPQSVAHKASRGSDIVIVKDVGTGKMRREWSPVRAVAMWLKLRIPFSY